MAKKQHAHLKQSGRTKKASGQAKDTSVPLLPTGSLDGPSESGNDTAADTRPSRLPGVLAITRKSLLTVWNNRRLFAGICAVYLLLNVIFASGLAGRTGLSELKATLDQAAGGTAGLAGGLALFAVLVTSGGGSAGETAGAYQSMILVIVSLAMIWALRMLLAGETIRLRDTFYKGMYPLVPFCIVLFVISLLLLPLVLGATLYNMVVSSGIVVNLEQHSIAALLFFGLALLSIYLISSAVIALYIAALPDMTPLKALRSAKQLVKGRRWSLVRKQLFLPLALLVTGAVVMLPFILFLPAAAPWIFFVLTAVSLVLIHAYLYTLYRELLP